LTPPLGDAYVVTAMPIYEYYCPRCDRKFEQLRPMARSDDPATCPQGHEGAGRVLSVFASMTRGADGSLQAVSGTGGCAACSAGSCAGCAAAH
jgi:putative FmdB family regulatory protein